MSTHIFIWDAKTNPQPQIVKAAETLLAGSSKGKRTAETAKSSACDSGSAAER
jgi:hypothetical protein